MAHWYNGIFFTHCKEGSGFITYQNGTSLQLILLNEKSEVQSSVYSILPFG